MVLYARESAWTDRELALLERLHLSYGHCLACLAASRDEGLAGCRRWLARVATATWLAALFLAMFIPVRLSVLAPAEVIALSATAVAAPQDGVIGVWRGAQQPGEGR
jgi:hypothetical protein